MLRYLVGILFHEPEAFAQWKRGLVEDCESSTGLYIDSDSAAEAVAWGEQVGQELLRFVNRDNSLNWSDLGYYCWIEESPSDSSWSHCLDFFQRVQIGEMPILDQMGTAAYSLWQNNQRDRGKR